MGLVASHGEGRSRGRRSIDFSMLADRCSFAAAVAHCDQLTFAGHDDWRLPTKAELGWTVDPAVWTPPLYVCVFPDVEAAPFWTSSPQSGGLYWLIDFANGASIAASPSASYPVRCVRNS